MALVHARSWISAFGVPAGRVVRVDNTDPLIAKAIMRGVLTVVADPAQAAPVYRETISRADLDEALAAVGAGVTPAQLAASTEVKTAAVAAVKAAITAGDIKVGGAGFDQTDIGYDVVGLLGQSNMAGGDTDTIDLTFADPTDPRIRQFATSGVHSGKIIGGADGLFHPFYQSSTVGPGMPFAREYVRRLAPNRSVLLVPAARGSSGFTVNNRGDTWDPANTTATTNLYSLALAKLDAALKAAGPKARLVGILWLQGETDATVLSQAAYAAKLDALIAGIRSHFANPTLPFVVGQMVPPYIASHQSDMAPVNAAHIDTPRRVTGTAFVYGSQLPANPASGGIHYSAAGARDMGPGWAEGLLDYAPANKTGTAPGVPGEVKVTQTDATSASVVWARTPGRVTNYTVQMKIGAGNWTAVTRPADLTLALQLTALPGGGTVTVRVAAVNEQSTSDWSTSAPLTLLTAPAQVTGLTLASPGSSSQSMTWNPSPTATGYKLEYRTSPAGALTTAYANVTGTSATVTGLTPVTAYDFAVTPLNVAGAGVRSDFVTGSTSTAPTVDSVSLAAFSAYSLRRVASTYDGPAVKVRRSSDSATQDIVFTPGGTLDTTALLNFVGSGSGYIDTWYDQSGNGRHMAQPAAAAQPRIVNAGTLDAMNGKPAAYFPGTAYLFRTGAGLYAAGASSVYSVAALTAGAGVTFAETNSVSGARVLPVYVDSSAKLSTVMRSDSAFLTTPNAGAAIPIDGTRHVLSTIDTGTMVANYLDSTARNAPTAYTRSGTFTLVNQTIGAWYLSGPASIQYGITGYMPELLVFPVALTSAQQATVLADLKSVYATA